MPTQRLGKMACEGRTGGAGEKAGRAGNAGERPNRARPARKVGMQTLQPDGARDAGGQQPASVFKTSKEAIQGFRSVGTADQRSTEPMITSIEPRMAMMSATFAPLRMWGRI